MIKFEHNFQRKFMVQTFADGASLLTAADVAAWRKAWMAELKGWHSPYSVVVDLRGVKVGDDPETIRALELMLKFFSGLHLRKIAAFGKDESGSSGHERLPFPTFAGEDEARAAAGARERQAQAPTDFRSSIRVENHFKTQVVELSFAAPVTLESKEHIDVVRSKLTNNLTQWHSPWSLLVDCHNLTVAPAAAPFLERALTTFRAFHMKVAVGYAPAPGVKAEAYPFKVYRARHKAAAVLSPEGAFSGDAAHCRSTGKTGP
jgi:hypothetical protein